MRNETERAIRVRIPGQIVRVNNPDGGAEGDQQHAEGPEEDPEELSRARLGLPL
jgi:hypothetical protein